MHCSRSGVGLFLSITVVCLLACQFAQAGSATWNLNPTSGDWNTDANWTPAIVPNGPADTATFGVSGKTGISLSASIEVNGLVFAQGASAYVITSTLAEPLTISGTGIINNSGIVQTFFLDQQDETPEGNALTFSNTATAGNDTAFSVIGGEDFLYGSGGKIIFLDSSSADHGTFDIFGGAPDAFSGAYIFFSDNSSAAEATFILHPSDGFFSNLVFNSTSTAGQATITNEGSIIFANSATAGSSSIANNRSITFDDTSSVDQATITNNAGSFSAPPFPGGVLISSSAKAAKSTIINQGGLASGLTGGSTLFFDFASAGNAMLIAESGVNGGSGGLVKLESASNGGTSRVEIFGNGQLDISGHDAPGTKIGSLEGDGLVFLGSNELSIGSNSLSTTFAGVSQDGGANGGDGGALTKIGSGTLTLSGSSTYTGKTNVLNGALLASNSAGSATGTGTVKVRAGTLGGSGIIAGPVTVGTGSGTGAFLAPAAGTTIQTRLTTQSALTLNSDATYTYTFKANTKHARTDMVIANGVTINGATLAINATTQGQMKRGLIVNAINNTSANPINGTFSNLADGAIVTVNGNNLQASYEGGDGNDLTLTVVP